MVQVQCRLLWLMISFNFPSWISGYFKYWSFEVSKQGYLNVRIKDFLIFVHIESGAEFSGLESSNNCKRQQSCVPNRPSVSTITLRVEKSGKRTNKSFLKQTNSSWESESTKSVKFLIVKFLWFWLFDQNAWKGKSGVWLETQNSNFWTKWGPNHFW